MINFYRFKNQKFFEQQFFIPPFLDRTIVFSCWNIFYTWNPTLCFSDLELKKARFIHVCIYSHTYLSAPYERIACILSA